MGLVRQQFRTFFGKWNLFLSLRCLERAAAIACGWQWISRGGMLLVFCFRFRFHFVFFPSTLSEKKQQYASYWCAWLAVLFLTFFYSFLGVVHWLILLGERGLFLSGPFCDGGWRHGFFKAMSFRSRPCRSGSAAAGGVRECLLHVL